MASCPATELTFAPWPGLIHNERVDAYDSSDRMLGTYANLVGAHRFDDQAKAERVCAELNEVVVRGGELLMDDCWEFVAET
jgi:hypothetical protein